MTDTNVVLKKSQGDEVVAKVRARQNAEALLKLTQVEFQKRNDQGQ